jgi:hypothetical protein
MEKFTVPETNLISIYAGETKKETISNIIDGIQSMDDSELIDIAEQSIIKLDDITQTEFEAYNFKENFTDDE